MDGKEWKNNVSELYGSKKLKKRLFRNSRVGSVYGICKGTFQIVTKIK